MTQKERMLSGQAYRVDAALAQEMRQTRELLRLFNSETDPASREPLLRRLLGSAGEGSYIEPPFRCDYGSNIHVGKRFYANFECIILDQCPIVIGDDVMLGPRVSLLSAAHPIDAETRANLLEYGRPITIGSSVWLGGGVTVLSGVTIGERAVIGAGSVVTKDIPSDCIAVGNPCRVLRYITEDEREHWRQWGREWTP